jgi:hypothetical protein
MDHKQLNDAIRGIASRQPDPAPAEPEPLILNGEWTAAAKPKAPGPVDAGTGTTSRRQARPATMNDLIRTASRSR